MRFIRPFPFTRLIYPRALYRLDPDKKELCLTFDDGPSPESTPRIIDILERQRIKAIFFCSGENAEKYPLLVNLLRSEGHIIGNHGYHHIDGWKTNTETYIKNVVRAEKATSSCLFRPPYGRISLLQYNKLIKSYKIVYWDIMSYDFNSRKGPEKVLDILKTKTRSGSVIVFHDKQSSLAATVLNDFIVYASNEGYNFVIPKALC